ncbi:MAG: futalosine hydrolase [Desulfonatronovibrio sp.]
MSRSRSQGVSRFKFSEIATLRDIVQMILFVAATVKEMQNFIRDELPSDIHGQQGRVQRYKEKNIAFLICGVGPLNAAINLERYLSVNKKINLVMNVGIAGSYDLQNLPLGSVCVASKEIWPEYGVRTSDFRADPELLGFPLDKRGRTQVWNSLPLNTDMFTHRHGLSLDPKWPAAVGVTLAGISSGTEQAAALKKYFRADMENMEGFALAYCCYLRSVSFAEIRAISNLAGSRNKQEWDITSAFQALGRIWSGIWAGESS